MASLLRSQYYNQLMSANFQKFTHQKIVFNERILQILQIQFNTYFLGPESEGSRNWNSRTHRSRSSRNFRRYRNRQKLIRASRARIEVRATECALNAGPAEQLGRCDKRAVSYWLADVLGAISRNAPWIIHDGRSRRDKKCCTRKGFEKVAETSRSEGHLCVIDWARWNGSVLLRFDGCFGECYLVFCDIICFI